MQDSAFGHHEYDNTTTLHPLGLAAVLVLGFTMLVVPRRFALVPMILMACFIAPAQRIVLFTLDFDLLRVMVVCGFMRLVFRGEMQGLTWKPIDTMIVLWAGATTVAYTALHGAFSDLVYILGVMFDSLGMYFLFRFLLREWRDFDRVILAFTLVSIPVAIAFLVEKTTGRNAFSVFGGVPEITVVREGRLRCQGAFAHPILAGCFWAGLLPLVIARGFQGKAATVLAAIGVAASAIVIVTCSSSTPVTACLFAAVGLVAWLARRWMRLVRWGLLAGLIGLHLVMKQPVWHLLARVDVVDGSTGYHRFLLIDQTIRNFGEWFVAGTLDTEHWGDGLFDVTNQFVLEAVRGGLVGLVLFVIVISLGFQAVGRAWRALPGPPWKVAIAWALGASLFVHVTNFLAVSYFGQIIFVWNLVLAMIATLAPVSARRSPQTTTQARPRRLQSARMA
ncbi:MAG: hypothetical protein HYR85_04980 [Planctomycetes bacterium]|nr:hypothetical protein [Planctomycetota bacterium]